MVPWTIDIGLCAPLLLEDTQVGHIERKYGIQFFVGPVTKFAHDGTILVMGTVLWYKYRSV